MLRKFAIPVLALLAVPAISSAQFEAGDLELTLTGNASAPKAFTSGQINAEIGLGYFATKELEFGVRQALTYVNAGDVDGSASTEAWGGSTRGAADYHFDLGAWQPFVGGFIGYEYLGNTTGQAGVGPEAGVKYFVNSTTFVYARVGYDYLLSEPKFSVFEGGLGIGFRF
jgi:Outer membrane protein beta-barrel domain